MKAEVISILESVKYDINWLRSELVGFGAHKEKAIMFLHQVPMRGGKVVGKFYGHDLVKLLTAYGVSFTNETFYRNGRYDFENIIINGVKEVVKLEELHDMICEFIKKSK